MIEHFAVGLWGAWVALVAMFLCVHLCARFSLIAYAVWGLAVWAVGFPTLAFMFGYYIGGGWLMGTFAVCLAAVGYVLGSVLYVAIRGRS